MRDIDNDRGRTVAEPSLQDILDAIRDGISVLDSQFNIVRVNHWMEKMYSTKSPLIGKKCYEVYQQRDSPCPFCPARSTLETGELRTAVVPYPSEEEPTGWIELSTYPLKDANGTTIGAIEHVKDITERKRAHEALEHLNLTLRAIRNVNQLITHEQDRDRLIRRACELFTSYKGYKHAWIALFDETGGFLNAAESGLGEAFQPILELLARGERPRCAQAALKQHRVILFEDVRSECASCPLATHYIEQASLAAPLEHGGKAYGVLSVCIPTAHASDEQERALLEEVAGDLAFALYSIELEQERKRTEESLRASEERFRSMFETMSGGVAVFEAVDDGRDFIFKDFNRAGEEIEHVSRKDVIGRRVTECFPGVREFGLLEVFQRVWSTGMPEDHPSSLYKDERITGWRENHVYRLPSGEIVAIYNDITKRKRAEEALRASEELYRAVFENTGTAMLIVEEDTTVSMVNSEFEKLSGYSKDEVEGKMSWTVFVVPEDLERMKGYNVARLSGAGEAPRQYEFRCVRKDGDIRDILLNVDLIGETSRSVVSLIDITEHKRAEERLLEAQKMEAIGRLAGGVAHDFNNILTAIIGNLDLVSMDLPATDPCLENIKEVRAAAMSASDLTQHLLAFSRKQIIAPKVLSINSVVRDMSKMLRRLIREDIEIQTYLQPDIPSIKADESQVEQVVLNLALNGRDTMPHGGKLTIETAVASLDRDYCSKHAYMEPGQYVMLAVTDTGAGMDQETLSHVFEPFFTTKPMGKGTGLGLSTVYGIVKQAGGSISAYSVEGEGSCFKAYFPAVETVSIQTRRAKTAPRSLEGRGETVLVVEDERAVRDLVERVLTRAGYKVKACSGAAEAIAGCRELGETTDLLLTDVVMPDMPGNDLADIISNSGKTKTLFMSGYAENVIVHSGILDAGVNFINKPFTSKELLRKVREVLDS